MRPWLALAHAGARFETQTADLASRADELRAKRSPGSSLPRGDYSDVGLDERRQLGSVTGSFPVLWVDDRPIHEALAICEWAAERFPEAGLWPTDAYDRALARSYSSEMATGFLQLRTHMPCHVFARVPGFVPNAETRREIDRVTSIWQGCLERSGGPFLFGRFGIVDCMYFPVLTRFETYGVQLPDRLASYASALWAHDAVKRWRAEALRAPALPTYDERVRAQGGNPSAVA